MGDVLVGSVESVWSMVTAVGRPPLKGDRGFFPRARWFSPGFRGSSPDRTGRVSGCYIHGLLADDRQRRHWLERLGATTSGLDYEADVDTTLDLLADHIEKHIDCDRLLALARPPLLTRRT